MESVSAALGDYRRPSSEINVILVIQRLTKLTVRADVQISSRPSHWIPLANRTRR